MRIDDIIFSSIGGSVLTIFINESIKYYKRRENLRKQKEIFIAFIDNIIIKYLELNIKQYKSLKSEVDNDWSLFENRLMDESPMLNKNIFDFFEREDLIKIFSYCKKNSIVEVYHNFYEIDFLQGNSPSILLNNYKVAVYKHIDEHKEEDFYEHIKNCPFYSNEKYIFTQQLDMNIKHAENLKISFSQVKEELLEIEDLKIDNYN